MKRKSIIRRVGHVFIACLASGLPGCEPDRAAAPVAATCSGFGFPPVTLAELKDLYPGEAIQLPDSLQWEAFVVSSDASSNIFGEIYLQDALDGAAGGLVFYTDLLETHARVPFGTRVCVNLRGLYLGESSGSFELGGAFPSFGNVSVGRLPANLFADHIRVLCDQRAPPVPAVTTIPGLSDSLLNTHVRVGGLEFIEEETGLPFADPEVETRRTLSDCEGNTLRVRNSGYSDFFQQTLPQGHGDVRGILTKYRNRYEIVVMDPSDFQFSGDRCRDNGPIASSDSILISEIADPDNLPGARFLELYNSSAREVDLRGWELLRYTNANEQPGRPVLLEGLKIGARSTLVFSAHPETFEAAYGFPPDLVVPENGPADSNGDDSLVLIDPFGNVKDAFGRPGTDGSGTAHEFEDGKAERHGWVQTSSSLFEPNQWRVFNDTGGSTTLNEPKNAPGDFSPGSHPSGLDP